MNSSGLYLRNQVYLGKARRIGRCIRICLPLAFAAAVFLLNIGRPVDALAQQRAWLKTGGIVEGRMTGTIGGPLGFVSRTGSGAILLAEIRQVSFDNERLLPTGSAPSGRLLLHGDESVPAETVSADESRVHASLFGSPSVSIRRSAVEGVVQPAGEQLRLHDDFELPGNIFQGGQSTSEEPHSGSKALAISSALPMPACTLTTPVSAGRLELAFLDSGATTPADEWTIVFEFGKGEQPLRWTFHPAGSENEYRCTISGGHSLARQSIERRKGWHRLTLLFGPERVFAFVDERLIATSRGWEQPLSVIRLSMKGNGEAVGTSRGKDPGKAIARAAIDDFLLMERVEDQPLPEFDRTQGLIWLATGDELFGAIDAVDSAQVRFSGSFGRRRVEWSTCRGVIFPAGVAPPSAPVRGLIATIDLAPSLAADARTGRLIGAIEAVEESSLRVRHPVLGPLSIPTTMIARIEPVFSGTLQMIDAATHHFGDEIREDFRRKLAEGTEREWKFDVAAVSKGTTWLTLLAADVEPGAPDAPRNGKFRDELDKGGLRTEFLLNGRSLGALNRHVRMKAVPANPERIRIALPKGLLRAGENVLKLRQHPAKDEPDQYDDCEISRLAIELD